MYVIILTVKVISLPLSHGILRDHIYEDIH